MRLLLLSVVVLLACVWTCDAEKCTSDYCNLVDCFPMTESECKGVFINRGSACGCCDACYDAIEPGQPCERLDYSNPPKAVCKNGYWCDNGICRIYLQG